MSTGNIQTAFKERGTGPYQNPVKCTVVAVAEEYSYTGKNGASMKAKAAAVSDGTSLAKVMCYDEEKFRFFKVDQTLVVRNTIRRVEENTKVFIVTKASKVYMAALMEVSVEHKELGKALVDPPPSEVVPISEALSSPPKKRISVRAKIVQEEELRNVEVKGQPVPIKTITVEDESGQGKVTLWRDCACAAIRPGEHFVITDVVTNTYNNLTSLSTTARSRVKKCEAPTSKKLITVEGISVTDSMAELFLEDGSCLTIDSDILHKAIMSQEPKENLEMCTQMGSIKLVATCQGTEILEVEKA